MTRDHEILSRVILAERQGPRSRVVAPDARDAFLDDSLVRLSWYQGTGPGFVAASELMSAGGNRVVHRLAPPVVEVDGDRAVAEVAATVEFQIPHEGTPAHLVSYTRFNYHLERRADRWKIYSLNAIYARDSLSPAVPGDTISRRQCPGRLPFEPPPHRAPHEVGGVHRARGPSRR